MEQRGATLIEVLITLLILKVGLLGVLAGQLQALKLVTDATQRTTAIALSHEVLQQLSAFNPPSVIVNSPEVNPCLAASCNHDLQQHVLARWQAQWQNVEIGYGILFAPEFCLEQQQGQLTLQATWQQHAGKTTADRASCQLSAGRSGIQLNK